MGGFDADKRPSYDCSRADWSPGSEPVGICSHWALSVIHIVSAIESEQTDGNREAWLIRDSPYTDSLTDWFTHRGIKRLGLSINVSVSKLLTSLLISVFLRSENACSVTQNPWRGEISLLQNDNHKKKEIYAKAYWCCCRSQALSWDMYPFCDLSEHLLTDFLFRIPARLWSFAGADNRLFCSSISTSKTTICFRGEPQRLPTVAKKKGSSIQLRWLQKELEVRLSQMKSCFMMENLKERFRRRSRILVRGAQWSFDSRGGRSWAQNFLKIGGFPKQLPENCMILKKYWGQGRGPGHPWPCESACGFWLMSMLIAYIPYAYLTLYANLSTPR